MRKSFFRKNLLIFLIPTLIPLLILGSLSIIITQHYIKDQINKNNINLLRQTQQNVELIFNELDSLNVNLSTNHEIVVKLKKILSAPGSYISYEDYDSLNIIIDLLSAPANAIRYIHSIYVYFNNDQSRFISSINKLSNLSSDFDISWYNSFVMQDKSTVMWTEIRNVKQYQFEANPAKILSIYRRLYSSGKEESDGVVILNVYVNYIEDLLNKLETYPDQSIFVLDEKNRLIFRNKNYNSLYSVNVNSITGSPENFFKMEAFNKSYTISKINSNHYDWKYISIVPESVLYHIPSNLIILSLLLGILSFVLGLLLTYYLTKRNYQYIQNIRSIIDSAKSGNPLPVLPSTIRDEYGYIIHNILTTFIEHSYLQVQLSERKYMIQALELKALQTQINPHFVFNTLDTINWKTIGLTGGPNEITRMIESLSDILKYSLDNSLGTVSLKEEIEATKSYVNIQQARYMDKFNVLWEYDEYSDRIMQFRVIKLMMQPLIENSIYHGIKEKEGSSRIKIKIEITGTFLVIGIIDSGLGIKPEKLAEIREKLKSNGEYPEHIGLFNTNKRLKFSFGEQSGITIRSKYRLGTAVYAHIPLQQHFTA